MISIFSFCSIFISILIALKYSHFASFLILKVLPDSEKLIVGFIAIIITFILSTLVINKISQFFKYVINFTLIGMVDDVVGVIFGSFTSALFISFFINIIQYFDISLFEIQIKESIISGYLINFAPQVLSYVTEFFPSLEEIINKMEHKELIV
jgi:uncharacterized membrane protein required for colicin V production|tara:strand:+ start:264 stop:722 length:459 start_codon:yes stop_codon:yes gene_type:complete